MDVLALYQPRNNAPLDDVAQLVGLPGKIGVGGAQVWSAYQAGKIAEIRDYCEADIANTYLLYLRFQLLRGALTAEQHRKECALPARDAGKAERRALARVPVPLVELNVHALDAGGHGIARTEGKVVFVEGALGGETVEAQLLRSKPTFDTARTVRVLKESFGRREPPCPYFDNCGGCAMQHVDARTQVAAKQRVLEDSLGHIGKVRPEQMLPPIYGPAWGYRHRARLSVRYVPKKGGALVGFHERRTSYVADMESCEVLPPHVSALIRPLRELVGTLSIREPPAADRGGGGRRGGGAGVPQPAAAAAGGRGAAAAVRGRGLGAGLSAAARAGQRGAVPSGGGAGPLLRAARVRPAHRASRPPISRRSTMP